MKKGGETMFQWNIYYEAADSDDPRTFLGVINADSMAQALDLAAEYYEYSEHDLVAERA